MTKRIEFRDIRSETIVGWIEYEDGEFYASDDEFGEMAEFYTTGGETDENTFKILAQLNNGVYHAEVVSE